MLRFNMGCTQEEIVKELELTEDDARSFASHMQSWFDILELEANQYQRFVKRSW